MTKEEILNYVTTTPSNTNYNVLKSLLDNLIESNAPAIEKTLELTPTKVEGSAEDLTLTLNGPKECTINSGTKITINLASVITKIKEELTKDADADADSILADKTAYVNGQKVTGTIITQVGETKELAAGQSETINKGYYAEDFTISAAAAAE